MSTTHATLVAALREVLPEILPVLVEEYARQQMKRSYSKKEVAEMFGYSVQWVDKRIKAGDFETVKNKGSVTRITARSINNFQL